MNILLIGNYPPPMCGWAMQTQLVAEELRARGIQCSVLNLNENRKLENSGCIDVQNAGDYIRKVWRHLARGYHLNVDVNAKSPKGYALALAAALMARLVNRPASLTFRGGVPQKFFPRRDQPALFWAFRALFGLAGGIACDDEHIKKAIASYGVPSEKIAAILPFSPQYVTFGQVTVPEIVEEFLRTHSPVWLSYACFREEYALPVARSAVAEYRARFPKAGFIWVGFPAKELTLAQDYVNSWSAQERGSVLICGNVPHAQFLTLMSRCRGYLRTPACDGVAASVLEALALGIPVVASENGRRPSGVVTYRADSASDMCASLGYVTANYELVRARLHAEPPGDNIAHMADWLTAKNASSVCPLAASER